MWQQWRIWSPCHWWAVLWGPESAALAPALISVPAVVFPHPNRMQAGEIGEMKDGSPQGSQLQEPVHWNPTYRPRNHRGPPHPQPAPAVGKAGDKEQPMVQSSHQLTADTDTCTTIRVAPVLLTLFHKMAKRPRQIKCHLRTLLQPPSRAMLSNTRLPRHLHNQQVT